MNRREAFKAAVVGAIFPCVLKEGTEKIHGVGVVRYPVEQYPNGTVARDMARNIAEHIRQGAVIGLPNTRDENGNFLWDFKIEAGDPGQVRIERMKSRPVRDDKPSSGECPECKSLNVGLIEYGSPSPGDYARSEAAGNFRGGCCIDLGRSPALKCRDCGHSFGIYRHT